MRVGQDRGHPTRSLRGTHSLTLYYDEERKVIVQELNFDNYYKGRTVNSDLSKYFSPSKQI